MANNNKNIKKNTNFKATFRTIISFCIASCTLVLAGFFTVLFYQWYSTTNEFNLKKIEVNNSYLLDRDDVVKVSGLKKGERILDVDLETVRQKLNKSNYISDCNISLILPATISITIKEEIPIAFLIKDDKLKYISESCQVIGDVKPKSTFNLPLINGKFSTKLIAFLGQARDVSPFVYYHISEICEDKKGIKLYLTQNSVPVIVGREDFSEKILVIENFLKEKGSSIDFANLEYLDLRFDKQVVVKEIKSEIAEIPITESLSLLQEEPLTKNQ